MVDAIPFSSRPERVEVKAPERNAGVSSALRNAFAMGGALPDDLARLLSALSRHR